MLGLDAQDALERVRTGDLSFLLGGDQVDRRSAAALGGEGAFFAALKLLAGDYPEDPESLDRTVVALLREAAASRKGLLPLNARFLLVERLSRSSEDGDAAEAAGLAASLEKDAPGDPRLDGAIMEGFRVASSLRSGDPGALGARVRDYALGAPVDTAFTVAWRTLARTPSVAMEDSLEALVAARLLAFSKDYGPALAAFMPFLRENPSLFLSYPELLGDLARSFQYGGAPREGLAAFDGALRSAALELTEPARSDRLYRLGFYSARMLRKEGDPGAAERFRQAYAAAPDGEQQDACAWYLVDLAASADPAGAIPVLRELLPRISDPGSLADLADRLCGELVARREWRSLYDAYLLLRPILDDEDGARWAYVVGRAIEVGHLKVDGGGGAVPGSAGGPADARSVAAGTAAPFFEGVLATGGAAPYYKILSALRLGIGTDPWGGPLPAASPSGAASASLPGVPPSVPPRVDPDSGGPGGGQAEPGPTAAAKNDSAGRKEALAFLDGFFDYGAGAWVYPYVSLYRDLLSSEDLVVFARAFSAAGLHADAIRTATLAARKPGHDADAELSALLYPQPFRSEFGEASERWGVDPALLYALARTESAFIPDVVSRSGAVGLTQLMPATAEGAARYLAGKVELAVDADGLVLEDPRTNLMLGAFYYSDLLRRLKSPMMALVSYNGGITRVRSWLRQRPSLPEDLFMETVPLRETREYGKKILAAAAAYGYLYYGQSPEDTASALLPPDFIGGE